MHAWLDRLKPRASRRVQLAALATLWLAVGSGLATAGVIWALSARWPWPILLIGAGVVLGTVKGRFVLAPAARRMAERIAAREDGSCLGGALSWTNWSLVAVMMAAGVMLRHSSLPRSVLGLLYVAIAAALLVGSACLWREFGGSRPS